MTAPHLAASSQLHPSTRYQRFDGRDSRETGLEGSTRSQNQKNRLRMVCPGRSLKLCVNNGMQLSVLSALARQDVDPSEEAACLARLPCEVATQRLTWLVAALTNGRSTRLDPGAIAARLSTLVPHGAGSDLRSRTSLSGVSTARPAKGAALIFTSVVSQHQQSVGQ